MELWYIFVHSIELALIIGIFISSVIFRNK